MIGMDGTIKTERVTQRTIHPALPLSSPIYIEHKHQITFDSRFLERTIHTNVDKFLNVFWTNMFSTCKGTQKHVPKHIQKQGPHFENTLWGLTHTYIK